LCITGLQIQDYRTADAGSFWLFTPDNIELVVRAIDGRAVDGHFWFFCGALTDVEDTITVTATLSGARKNDFNPQGNGEPSPTRRR
jgi:hypothetical protein